MTAATRQDGHPDLALPGPEWWERLSARWQRWRQRHESRLARWARVRTIAIWAALAGLAVAFVVFSQFRAGLKIWFWLYLLLIGWFLVARTKTVSWRLLAGVFAVSVPWSMAIAAISTSLSKGIAGVDGVGNGTAIAGMTEESLKLVPLAVLALAAPGLVRRFAVVDWLLLGFASGLAFQAFEELARRTFEEVRRPGVFDLLDRLLRSLGGEEPYGPGSGYAQYGFSLLAGGSSTDLAAYAGHHVFSALVAAGVGFGVAAWRRGARLAAGGATGAGWRVLALLTPLVLWWLVVCDHFGYNATLAGAGRSWVETDTPTAPWLIRATWDWFGDGFGRGWLLLILLLLAMLVDARHRRRGESGLAADRYAVRLISLLRLRSATGRAAPVARWAAAAIAAAGALVAYTVRDVAVVLAAHARQPGESRLAAIAGGRVAVVMLRDLRIAAAEAAAPRYGRWGRRPGRLVAAAALALLLIAALVVAPAIAEQIGVSLTQPGTWLAGVLDGLADWWDGLGLGGQILVGVGIAALIALSGGSLGLAFGLSGVATFVLDKGHGLADFSRDPGRATRSYFATTSPLGMALDLAEFGLTFAPGNFGGSLAGQYGRRVGLRTLAPRLNPARLGAGRSVILVDGATMRPLSEIDTATFGRWSDTIEWQNAPRNTRPETLYQRRIYGDREPLVSSPGQQEVWGDGLNPGYGSVGDAKFRANASSWYDPNSLDRPFMRDLARADIERRLQNYKRVLDDPANPMRSLEITTNDPRVAQVFSEAMRRLDVPGYVVIVP